MKRITSIIITAALIAALAGCNKAENSDSNSTSTADNSTTESAVESDGNTSTSEPELSDDVKKLLEKFPKVAEYTGYDGNVMPLDRIKNVKFSEEFNPTVTYDLGYMTYGSPVFATSLDNDDWKSDGDGFSDVLDWLRYCRDEAEKSFPDHNFFMVKSGDKLENGLVVKTAEQYCITLTPEDEKMCEEMGTPLNILSGGKIEFDGTLTLEGVLYKYEGDPQYFSLQNDVFFYPDTTKNEFVPMYWAGPTVELLNSDVGVIHDGSYYLGNLGNIDDIPSVDYDVDEIFGDKNYARVRITLENIYFDSSMSNSSSFQNARIADAELLD